MLCEKCKKNHADTHISKTVNGVHYEMNLCSACAAEEGFENLGGGLFGMLAYMFGENAGVYGKNETKRCKQCGRSFSDIAESGRLGCAECYKTFSAELEPSLQRIHGKIKHIGKHSKAYNKKTDDKTDIEKLKEKLSEAVSREEYEKAAEIRDEIKKLEGKK